MSTEARAPEEFLTDTGKTLNYTIIVKLRM